jgi:hypothetical protein
MHLALQVHYALWSTAPPGCVLALLAGTMLVDGCLALAAVGIGERFDLQSTIVASCYQC